MQNLILGIESSCDETSFAVISLDKKIIWEKTSSQINIHKNYGGVVPEIASRNHLEAIQILFEDLKTKIDISQIASIAVTAGPGLIGSLLIGISFAKGLAISLNVPIIAINHLEGHIMSCMIKKEIEFPFLLLLVSGGHSQFILANKFGDYDLISSTLDDAAGEAFDKIAKMLNLEYPGGPNLEKLANLVTDKSQFQFKPCLINNKTLNFSFSGLKTQILYKIREFEKLTPEISANIAFSAQKAIIETLIKKAEMIFKINPNIKKFVVCGGVSANKFLQNEMQILCKKYDIECIFPSLKYATDNGTMIAFSGLKRFLLNQKDNLNFQPKIKWPLSELKISQN